jgi:hypothetical protein
MKNGLDADLLDERSESSEAYRQRGELIADFFRNNESRLMSVEYNEFVGKRMSGRRQGFADDSPTWFRARLQAIHLTLWL